MYHSIPTDLQRRLLKAEATLRQKEEENVELQQQLQEREVRWSEYERQMKSMEEMWQKQISFLQVNPYTGFLKVNLILLLKDFFDDDCVVNTNMNAEHPLVESCLSD